MVVDTISACENSNISAIGYDPGKDLVNLGVKFLKKNQIYFSNEKDFLNIIKNTEKKVVSMLGVLEHVYSPNSYLQAFKNSKAKYLFFKVPLLSFSTFLENSNQKVFPRQLSHGHTHLFTYNSIKYMLKKYNFIILGEWWFGTDIPDLLRTLLVNAKYNNKKNYE